MSSSRSIAAARNRRAIEQQQPNLIQRSRPNTSIASQPAFSQSQPNQQYQQQYQQQKRNNANLKPSRNFQSGSAPGSIPVAVNKISVSDAIGLITIRLGRVEQFMQSVDEQGFINSTLSGSGDGNKSLHNNEIMDNLIERIYSLENKPVPVPIPLPTDNILVDNLKNTIIVLEREILSLKEILKNQMNKLDGFIIDTENKFSDIENAFVEMEKKDTFTEVKEEEVLELNENIQLILKESEVEQEIESSIPTVDLKSIINKELASEEL
jgi:hypothetical protein